MKSYDWILFDADDTLFHFDGFAGLRRMFAGFGIAFNEQDFNDYGAINQPLWIQYQDGQISADQLQTRRFDSWSRKLNVPSSDLNSAFLDAMADICTPLDGAVDLLIQLDGKFKLGIITNGFSRLQRARLERTGLHGHFAVLVISEEVGFAKPHRGIFDQALAAMGEPARDRVLMVGDRAETDILGGINAGFDTCWFNADRRTLPTGIVPTYEVTSLHALRDLLALAP